MMGVFAGSHQHDHGLAHSAAKAHHHRREDARARGEDHHPAQGLPRGCPQCQRALGQMLGHREDRIFSNGEDGGDDRKAMAIPTTSELRWSNLMPIS